MFWFGRNFKKPLFFSRSNVSRDTPGMRTRQTVGVKWRPFAFWFNNIKEIGKVCLNGWSDSCFGCCFSVQQLQRNRQWSIRLEMYPVRPILVSSSTFSILVSSSTFSFHLKTIQIVLYTVKSGLEQNMTKRLHVLHTHWRNLLFKNNYTLMKERIKASILCSFVATVVAWDMASVLSLSGRWRYPGPIMPWTFFFIWWVSKWLGYSNGNKTTKVC